MPPVNKATWSFESILPREGSRKTPERKPLEMPKNQSREDGARSETKQNQFTVSESTKLLEEKHPHIEANTAAASAASTSFEAFATGTEEKDMKDTVEGTLTKEPLADGDGFLGADVTKEENTDRNLASEENDRTLAPAPALHSGELEDEGKKVETAEFSDLNYTDYLTKRRQRTLRISQ